VTNERRHRDLRIIRDPRSEEAEVIEAAKRLIEFEGDQTRRAIEHIRAREAAT
jgi:hypothetical protein